MKNTIVAIFLVTVVIFTFGSTPSAAKAATTGSFQPRTNAEELAYLYGQLALLQAQLAALQQQAGTDVTTTGQNPYRVRVTTAAPIAVGRTTAELRGEVDRGTASRITVWTEYGSGSTFTNRTNEYMVTSRGEQTVSARLYDLTPNTTYRYRMMARDTAGNRIAGVTRSFTTTRSGEIDDRDTSGYTGSGSTYSSARVGRNPYFLQVLTLAPSSVGRTTAELRGEINRGASSQVLVRAEYGLGSRLTNRTSTQTITRGGRQAVTLPIDDLQTDSTYSYRLIAEDIDGNLILGEIRTFTTVAPTDTLTFRGRPSVETEGVSRVTASGATIQGFVSMNDYGTGRPFFVFGSDRERVTELESRYRTFTDIPTVRGEFGTRSVSTTFTGRNTVTTSISGLAPATRHYYRACVEYTDGSRTRLTCGNTETFITMN
jgi:hypothetical protein